jgi:hypothetical protein
MRGETAKRTRVKSVAVTCRWIKHRPFRLGLSLIVAVCVTPPQTEDISLTTDRTSKLIYVALEGFAAPTKLPKYLVHDIVL